MTLTSQQKGKIGELWVFGKLIDAGVNVYLPMVDIEGIDAIVRKKDGTLLEIQVKSTRAEDQAGYFNARLRPAPNLFIVCVDMSPVGKSGAPPEVWIFPSGVFANPAYSAKTKGGEYRLALAARSRKHQNRPRKELLAQYHGAWKLLTGP